MVVLGNPPYNAISQNNGYWITKLIQDYKLIEKERINKMKAVTKISVNELREMAAGMYGDMVKADVDVAEKTMMVNGELHADMEALMLENGSLQENLWGINLYPDDYGTENFVEFDS
jgi:hypothetical protein